MSELETTKVKQQIFYVIFCWIREGLLRFVWFCIFYLQNNFPLYANWFLI